MAKDLYKTLKGNNPKIEKIDFKDAIFSLCDTYLKSRTLSNNEMQKVARLRAYIEINFKDF